MPPSHHVARVDTLRHAALDLHKAMIEEQRIVYERAHGRIGTSSEFLGLLLEHEEFEWIRALSALIAQLDEWCEEPGEGGEARLGELLTALRLLLQREGPNTVFAQRYWEMIDSTPAVLVEHVKVARLLKS